MIIFSVDQNGSECFNSDYLLFNSAPWHPSLNDVLSFNMSSLITEEQLKEWLGYESRTKIVGLLKQYRIPYITAKDGRVCRTIGAIDNFLIGRKQAIPAITFK